MKSVEIKVVNKGLKRKINIGLLIASIIFGIYAVTLLIPLFWGLMMSFQSKIEYIKDKMCFPWPMHFENYVQAFVELESNGTGLASMFANSMWFALGGAFMNVLSSILAAYACAKYKFFMNKVMYWISIIAMMIPIMGSLPAQYKVACQLGLYDNPLTIISSATTLGMTFLVSYAFFRGVSWSYAESAFIDGAGHFRVFFQIMLPQAFSPLIALLLTGFVSRWNDATTPLIFLPSWPTLAAGFYIYQIESARALNYPVLFAGLFVSAIPIIALYVIFQNTLLDLQIGGGLKG